MFKITPYYLWLTKKRKIEVTMKRTEGLVSETSFEKLICKLISRCQHTQILKVMLMIFPRNNPAAPRPRLRKTIVEHK
jgi:hypothetical protein